VHDVRSSELIGLRPEVNSQAGIQEALVPTTAGSNSVFIRGTGVNEHLASFGNKDRSSDDFNKRWLKSTNPVGDRMPNNNQPQVLANVLRRPSESFKSEVPAMQAPIPLAVFWKKRTTLRADNSGLQRTHSLPQDGNGAWLKPVASKETWAVDMSTQCSWFKIWRKYYPQLIYFIVRKKSNKNCFFSIHNGFGRLMLKYSSGYAFGRKKKKSCAHATMGIILACSTCLVISFQNIGSTSYYLLSETWYAISN
jgi:hypothetical protein